MMGVDGTIATVQPVWSVPPAWSETTTSSRCDVLLADATGAFSS